MASDAKNMDSDVSTGLLDAITGHVPDITGHVLAIIGHVPDIADHVPNIKRVKIMMSGAWPVKPGHVPDIRAGHNPEISYLGLEYRI